MNFKIIIFRLFFIITIISQVCACETFNNAKNDNQTEKTADEKKVAISNKKDKGNSVFKKNVNKFFLAFGKLFEQKLITDNDSINLLHEKTNQSKSMAINSNADTTSIKKSKEVFGFHPYWSSNSLENYNYKLLSSISYFAYDLDPNTGKYKTLRDWKTTKLIDSAKANNTKVYLTVTNFLEENNITFLNNKKAQETSISTILQLLIEREAYGVTIDFEDIPCIGKDTIYTRKYSNYIKNLYTRLKEFDKKVVVMLPAIDIQNCFDVTKLYPYVEYFIVMGYNYYGSWSDVAGPVAPLHGEKLWTQWSLEATIESYLKKNIPKEKIVLAIPNYGNVWETENDNVPSYTKKFISNLSYKTIKKKYSRKKVYFEPESQTNYLNFKDGKKFMQVWFDDARSLGKKYDYINNMELKIFFLRMNY